MLIFIFNTFFGQHIQYFFKKMEKEGKEKQSEFVSTLD